jgi:hypothetical protein
MQGAEMTTGSVFFVDSSTGLSGNSGRDIKHPLATIDQAINKCTANKGDIIYAMPGHAEALGNNKTSLVPDIAGISIIGIGQGDDMPTITGSGVNSEIEVTADNIRFKNLRFEPGVDACLTGIDVNAHHFTMEDCVMDYKTATYDWVDYIDISAFDHAVIRNNRFIAQAAAGANTAIHLVDANWVTIEGNTFIGYFAEAPIWNITTACIGIMINNNFIYNDDTANADNGISLQAACTGLIAHNTIMTLYDAEIGAIIDPGSCGMVENYITHKIDTYAIATGVGTAAT